MWEVPQGLKNLWRFRKAVWGYSDSDYQDTLRLMQVGFKGISDHLIKHNIKKHDKKYARQLLVVSELCRRLSAEDQYDYWLHQMVKKDGKNYRRYADHYRYMYDQDLAYLQKMFKFLPHWWC